MPDKAEILAQLSHINEHVIGRSANQKKLFEYLIFREIDVIEGKLNAQQTPKEIEIAIAVFGKDVDFNPAEDSIVRVNISNLRKKLESYYMLAGQRDAYYISIPIGGYRLVFTKNSRVENELNINVSDKKTHSKIASATKKSRIIILFLLLIVVLSLAGNAWQAYRGETEVKASNSFAGVNKHPIWQDFNRSKKTVIDCAR